jgi:hypothetical protein
MRERGSSERQERDSRLWLGCENLGYVVNFVFCLYILLARIIIYKEHLAVCFIKLLLPLSVVCDNPCYICSSELLTVGR